MLGKNKEKIEKAYNRKENKKIVYNFMMIIMKIQENVFILTNFFQKPYNIRFLSQL